MAKGQVRPERNAEYVNVSAEEFSEAVQTLLSEEREIYQLLKAQKAKVLTAVRAEMPVHEGREITAMGYTRWGQLQMTVQDKVVEAAAPKRNKTLAEYLAERAAAGVAS